ncbi:MAG: cytochrome C [Desulfuromonadales bacterium]
MKIDRRDGIFIAAAVVVLGIFVGISGKEKTKLVPNNEMHKISYDAAYRNAPGPGASIFKRAFFKPDKKAAEAYCEPCHKEKGVPFSPNHPAKNRCMFCHKFKR